MGNMNVCPVAHSLAAYEAEQDRAYRHDLALDSRASEIMSYSAELEMALVRMTELYPGYLAALVNKVLAGKLEVTDKASLREYLYKTAYRMAEDEDEQMAADWSPEQEDF